MADRTATGPEVTPAAAVLVTMDRGAGVGRYVILDRLGEGGMGVVYAAYDPELDRRVAVKVLRVTGDEASGQLLGEARALASIRHPNVVPVHDVGAHGGGLFVAMDLIDGTTLRAWQDERPRGWRETLSIYARAGRGLAAVHAAGLVHRDFKPENVLLDGEGHVYVTDFGLARGAGSGGGVAGTPAYMSPEQLAGDAVDARSDQFGFCVALYGALYGEAPFPAEGRLEAVRAGAVRPAPAGARVPGAIRRVLLRGLRPAAGERYPSMPALLGELTADPGARRRRLILAAGAAVLVAAAAAVWPARRDPAAECAGAVRHWDGVWGPDGRETLARTFIAAGVGLPEERAATAARLLDDYRDRWVAEHEASCRRTRVAHTQPEEVYQQEQGCLRRLVQRGGTLVRLLGTADQTMISKAAAAIAGLPPPQACGDVHVLEAEPVPRSPSEATLVAILDRQLQLASALQNLGRLRDALPVTAAAVAMSRALPGQPLLGRALKDRAEVQATLGSYQEAVATFEEAGHAALATGDELLAAHVFSGLGQIFVKGLTDLDEASRWTRMALPMATRVDPLGEEEAFAWQTIGQWGIAAGKLDEAHDAFIHGLEAARRSYGAEHVRTTRHLLGLGSVEMLRRNTFASAVYGWRALELVRRAYGDHELDVSVVWFFLGDLAEVEGHIPECLERHRKALAIREAMLGPTHNVVAQSLGSIGKCQMAAGDYVAARATLERSLAIQEAFGQETPQVASKLTQLAIVVALSGDVTGALPLQRRALDILRKTVGAGHRDTAGAAINVGSTLVSLERPAEALPYFEEARATLVALKDPALAAVLVGVGNAQLALHDPARALPAFEQAAAVPGIKASGVGGDALLGAGLAEAQLGRAAAARATFGRALAAKAPLGDAHPAYAETRFGVAQGLMMLGDRAAARALATEARPAFVQQRNAARIAAVDALLAGRDPDEANRRMRSKSDPGALPRYRNH